MMVVIRVSPEQTAHALHYISVLYLAVIEFQLWNQLDLAYCLHVSQGKGSGDYWAIFLVVLSQQNAISHVTWVVQQKLVQRHEKST